MRDKHLHIAADSKLLKTIYSQAGEQLAIDGKKTRALIWLKFAFYFILAVAGYFTIYTTEHSFLFVLYFVFYGFIALLLAFNFAHDFSHGTIFKNKKWNHAGFILIYALNGAHAEAWKQRHIASHHYAPNVEDYDSDLQISGLIRLIPNSKHSWYHRFQHLYAPLAYTTYSLFWVFVKDFVLLFSKDDSAKQKGAAYHFSFWMQKLFYITYLFLFPLLFSQQSWYIVITAFIAMHLVQSLFLLFTFMMTHHMEATEYPVTDHNGFIQSSWLMNQVKSSNDMHPFSRVANFILGGFNNHIAHHLFPHVHHVHYPELSRILYGILLKHNVTPNHTTYLGGIVSHLRLLKKMSKEDHGLQSANVKISGNTNPANT